MNNQVTLLGAISSGFTYDHSVYGEKFYKTILTVERDSGTGDNIPVIVSERLVNIDEIYIGQYVAIRGQFRSYNLHEPNKNRLILFVFAQSVELVDYNDNINDIFIEGFITKPPVYRVTPLRREIADVMLGVTRDYNKVDYIPCVCWGRSAKYVSSLAVGTYIRVAGRVQSRDYLKGNETRTAYAVSVNLVEAC